MRNTTKWPFRVYTSILSYVWALIHQELVINQNSSGKRQNWDKHSQNVKSIIYLNTFRAFICFQDDNCEYKRSLFYEVFISNITKLISANLQEGNKGTSEKLRYVRVSMNFTLNFSKTKDFFCIHQKLMNFNFW